MVWGCEMWYRSLSLRVTAPTLFLSLLLLAVCGTAAVLLYRHQAVTAQILERNVASHRIAYALEITVTDLLQSLRAGRPELDALHSRVDELLAQGMAIANEEEETALVEQVHASWMNYRQFREADADPASPHSPGPGDTARAIRQLEEEVLPGCRAYCTRTAQRIAEAEAVHCQTVPWMAWGLTGVGIAGAMAGLCLGYGMARGLQRSIGELSVCVQDAAGKLGHDRPTVVVTRSSDLFQLQDQVRGLVREVGQVVERLQLRERQMLRAEQLAVIGQLAAGMAHELRNPLTSIKLLVQAQHEEAEERKQPVEDLLIMEQEIRRMERCLQTFRDFARPPKLERRLFDLTSTVERVFALLETRARKQGVRLEFARPRDGAGAVEADEEQIQQLLVNLVLNALDAMPHGGTVRVEVGRTEDSQVQLQVMDTGPGLPLEALPRLFEPFVSSKETGLGLGLAVSRRIAESHGGTLTGANRTVGGACFVLQLPVSDWGLQLADSGTSDSASRDRSNPPAEIEAIRNG